jgi:hypothetical protein
MNMDPTGYNCVYQDVDGDGDFFDQDGGPCGGGGMGTSQHLSSGGVSASVNDVYSTGINSGMGNMISSHGPTSHWMNGIYSHGSFASSVPSTFKISEKALNHILNGDSEGKGGHLDGSKTDGDKFPSHWTAETIIRAAYSVVNSPISHVEYQGEWIRYDGYYGATFMRVVINDMGWIHTTYPINKVNK